MNVLYVNTSGQLGGTETSLLTLLEGLRKLHSAWEITLLLGEDGPLAARARILGIRVHVLPLPRELASIGGTHSPALRWIWNLFRALLPTFRYRRHLESFTRQLHPEVIHASGFKMQLLLASLSRSSLGASVRVCHVHDYVTSRPLERRLLNACSTRYDRLIANSKSVAADLLKASIAPHKIITIYNGLPLHRFSPSGEKLDLDQLSGMPPPCHGAIRVGLVATFARWKGHATFMRALALLPPALSVRGYIIGGPIYQTSGSQYTHDELHALAQQNCPAVELGFTGVIQPIETAYRALDIVVHASTEPEPFGMAIAEAMACARPVIVSRGGGAEEIWSDNVTALAHSPGDAAMLAHQIGRLATDPALRQRLGESARTAVVAHFPAEAAAARFADLYQALIDARRERACAQGGETECLV